MKLLLSASALLLLPSNASAQLSTGETVSAQQTKDEPVLPACDLEALPDTAPPVPEIRVITRGADTKLRFLEDAQLSCGFSVAIKFETRAARSSFMRDMPEVAKDFSYKFFGRNDGPYQRRNSQELIGVVPAESWQDGSRRAARIAFQTLDTSEEFNSDEGVVCLLLLSDALTYQADAPAKQKSWSIAAEKLMTACVLDMELTQTAASIKARLDAAENEASAVLQMERTRSALHEASRVLFPQTRPDTWPPIKPRSQDKSPPPAIAL